MPFAVNVKLQNILDIVKTSIIIKLKLNQNINHGNSYIKKQTFMYHKTYSMCIVTVIKGQ